MRILKKIFKVNKLGKNNYQLLADLTPQLTLKSDYFKLNKYGFDNLDLKRNEINNYCIFYFNILN